MTVKTNSFDTFIFIMMSLGQRGWQGCQTGGIELKAAENLRLLLLGKITGATPEHNSSSCLSVLPVVQSPSTVYTAPGTFSHPPRVGDTA